MDKQEAIDYVLDELDKGRSLPEITAALSRQLGAPGDMVGKFVTQTAERYAQSKAALGESLAASPQPLTTVQKQSGFGPPPAAFSQPLSPKSQPPIAVTPQTAANQPSAAVEPLPEPDASYEPPPPAEPLPPAGPVSDVSPELEEYILDELGKNRRDSDVVLGVVEKTGMEYRQAQRLVSRVGARNYKKVTSRQNCLIIPLALVALVAGLVLLGASVIEAYQIRFLLPSPNNLNMEQVQAVVERGRDLPWAFITGLALSVGGCIGLISAIRKQME
jgi:hypothetical protein